MKTKIAKSIMAPLVVACVLVNHGRRNGDRAGTQGGRLEGTWEMQLARTDCAGHVLGTNQSIVIFMVGGTMIESQARIPQALKTPGEGVWRHTTDNDYAFRFKDFTFNAQNVFTGWVIIAGELTVDKTGNANAGSATVKVYDPNGVLLVSLCAETAGTRFDL
jgi:hypothetical protein